MGGFNRNILRGDEGQERIIGGFGPDTIFGGEGDDKIVPGDIFCSSPVTSSGSLVFF